MLVSGHLKHHVIALYTNNYCLYCNKTKMMLFFCSKNMELPSIPITIVFIAMKLKLYYLIWKLYVHVYCFEIKFHKYSLACSKNKLNNARGVIRSRKDNTTACRKSAMLHKKLHRKLKIEQR